MASAASGSAAPPCGPVAMDACSPLRPPNWGYSPEVWTPLLAFLLTNGFSTNYHYRADAFGHDFAAFVKSRGGVNGWPRKKAHMDLLYTVFERGEF